MMKKNISILYRKVILLLRLPFFRIFGNRIKMTDTIGGDALLRHSSLGDYIYIGPRASVLWADIGNYSCIAGGVSVGGMNHEYRKHASINPLLNPYCHMDHRIKIGRDVWIGSKCVILQGVSIGDGAIIGAGSVVTKNVPENTIVIGSPARFYKNRFSDEVWNVIKGSNYWDYSPEEAKRILEKLDIHFPIE